MLSQQTRFITSMLKQYYVEPKLSVNPENTGTYTSLEMNIKCANLILRLFDVTKTHLCLSLVGSVQLIRPSFSLKQLRVRLFHATKLQYSDTTTTMHCCLFFVSRVSINQSVYYFESDGFVLVRCY